MRIASLQAENFKRLVCVEITPAGNVVQITGKNANGKSSLLDAINVAIEGLDACPGEPIRKGEKKAQIRVKLSGERELIVTRKFTRKDEGGFTSSLTVESADGAVFKSPQKLLDDLLGELAFDPLEFTRLKDREQFDALSGFAPGVDFAEIEAQNKGDFERRTDVNRQAKQSRAAADVIVVPEGTPAEAIDEAALTTELEAAGTLNTDVERRTLLRAHAAKDVETHRAKAQTIIDGIEGEVAAIDARFAAQIAGFEQQIAALQRQIEAAKQLQATECSDLRVKRTAEAATATQEALALQTRLEAAPPLAELIDTKAIKERIEAARVTNANVARLNQKALHLATAKKYETEAEELTAKIDARNDAKRKAIAAAKMPVPGLDFGDGIVLLNGVPFRQASSAEQLRTSCAIAMAKNPTLRVCFVRDGSLLDEDGLRLIGEMADEKQFQVFIEKVDSSGKIGFVIEDGQLRGAAAAERSAA